MSENFKRIMDGLEDAVRIAQCDHTALPFAEGVGRTVWICSSCGGRFNWNPAESALMTEAAQRVRDQNAV